MLSKRTFLPTKSLFVAAGIAACGLAAVQQSANALDISFDTQSGQDYKYGIVIGGTESVETGDVFTFNGLSGVIGNSITGGTALDTRLSATGFTPTSATFTALQDFGNVGFPVTFSELVITSTDDPGTVSWTGESNLAPFSFSGTINGPAVVPSAAVPFEFSPGLGLFLSGTIFGALKLRSKFGKKEELNF